MRDHSSWSHNHCSWYCSLLTQSTSRDVNYIYGVYIRLRIYTYVYGVCSLRPCQYTYVHEHDRKALQPTAAAIRARDLRGGYHQPLRNHFDA
jgi:hypothetical protein